jgi:hypothetical protein
MNHPILLVRTPRGQIDQKYISYHQIRKTFLFKKQNEQKREKQTGSQASWLENPEGLQLNHIQE